MELEEPHKIILKEYAEKGKVWAEMPRQSGKTSIILEIIKTEQKKNNTIMVVCPTLKHYKNIVTQLENTNGVYYYKEMKGVTKPNVIIGDETYIDIHKVGYNTRICCLRTPCHKTLRFSYKDFNCYASEHIGALREVMSEEEFNNEYDLSV